MPGSGQSTSHNYESFFEGDVAGELVGVEADLVHALGFGETSVNVVHEPASDDRHVPSHWYLVLEENQPTKSGTMRVGERRND